MKRILEGRPDLTSLLARIPLLCLLCLLAFLSAGASGCVSAVVMHRDVCVYGGTAAGVAAAVQAARMGRSVMIVEPGRHLGGMTSSGLGATDAGDKGAVGGLAREFYRRVGKHYGLPEAWRFEPHAAEETFREMLREVHVQVVFDAQIESVEKWITRIAALEARSVGPGCPWKRLTVRARVYIDASYEGDLMALAGVSHVVGREANAQYGETLNGIRPETPHHQFEAPVDPYLRPADPSSGLLPFIQEGDGGAPGEGDERVQAYSFRLCLTRDPSNRLPIAPPPGYDPARYELLARYLEALVSSGRTPKLEDHLSIIEMPNGKTDVNNKGAFSTDFIGASWAYPEAGPSRRARIRKEHEDYTRGLLHFLATSPRVPESLREEMRAWGLAADEFQETGGWPHQLYIREARRMVSEYVMTEHDCRGAVTAPDPIGMGSYNMDSHNCQRIAKGGRVENEGDVQVRSVPYAISYRSIVPWPAECENLLVPVCLSASHIAYGSIRMEPVFMILGQSAATAACLAIEDRTSVQDVDREKLRARLIRYGQVLELEGEGPLP